MSIHNQEKKVKRVNEIITKRKCFDLLTNPLNQFFKEMYEDQSGEFVFGHLDLKGEQCSLPKISILTPLVYSSLECISTSPSDLFLLQPQCRKQGRNVQVWGWLQQQKPLPKISFLTLVVDWNFPFCFSSSPSLCCVPVHYSILSYFHLCFG